MLKAVAFDLWETLITNSHEQGRRQEARRLEKIAAALRAFGQEADADHLQRAYRHVWSRCYDLYWSQDIDIPTRTQVVHLLEGLGVHPEALDEGQLHSLEQAYADTVLEIPPSLVPHAAETLQWAKAKGWRTGLISNTGRTPGSVLRPLLDQLRIGHLIDFLLFSNEEGFCKPQKSIFLSLQNGLEAQPGEIVFVGDNLEADVAGAKACGMHAVHFIPPVVGTAVAPARGDRAIEPDATIYSLAELPAVVERFDR